MNEQAGLGMSILPFLCTLVTCGCAQLRGFIYSLSVVCKSIYKHSASRTGLPELVHLHLKVNKTCCFFGVDRRGEKVLIGIV